MEKNKVEKKYELLKDSIKIHGCTLYRIRAIKDIFNSEGMLIAEKGDLGGYVQSEKNLSHNGGCWIFGSDLFGEYAMAYGNSSVLDDAKLMDRSIIHGKAVISGTARAIRDANIAGDAVISGNALVSEVIRSGHYGGSEYDFYNI